MNDRAFDIDSKTIDCWRTNYGLDKTPHELHAYWSAWAPPGAVLALKAAVGEIERLRAVALEHIPHKYEGDCPDELDRSRRDKTCPACLILGA